MSNQTEHDEGNTDQGIIPEETTSGQNDLSSFEEQMTSMEVATALSTGQLVTGIFVGMQETTAVVSIGQKLDGIIPAENMQTLSQSEVQSLIIGSELTSVVIRIGTNDSPTILSLDKAKHEAEVRPLLVNTKGRRFVNVFPKGDFQKYTLPSQKYAK